MSIEMVNLKAQYAAVKDEIDAAVQEVVDGCVFILGESVTRLERRIAEVSGAAYGVSVASGTDAILIGLRAMGIGAGDEVITTPFTMVATTEAIALTGARAVYADIDPVTLNIDPADIEQRITPRTKAIVPVHLFGSCADMTTIRQIARTHNLGLLADAAQAIGAVAGGQPIGAMADVSTLSFYPTKNLGAYGDGGMILTNDESLAAKAKSLRYHGMKPGSYYHDDIGYCSRLDELQAAILLVKLKYLESWNEKRRQNAAVYLSSLADMPVSLPALPENGKHTFHQFTLRYNRRDEMQAMLREKGIGSAIYYPLPLHMQPAYRCLGYSEGDFPNAEAASREVLSVPVHADLTDEQVQFVGATIRSAIMELERR
ncbi:MAG: DegT/DnrJ/EryC1/StrS family aminotransferase [Armatimonadota bacterium]|nr:DegT/DnrJ/EryC1/StrS family aminotransferase [Armatimonadota bacterium]